MMSKASASRPEALPRRPARLALAMDMDGLALMERTPSGWTLRTEISLNEPDFDTRMGVFRDEALALGGGDGVEIWLPAEQVLPVRVRPVGSGPGALRHALADATPHAVNELIWDVAPKGENGIRVIVATWRKTVEEAQDFAGKWALSVTRVTTRAADADFPDGPSFVVEATAAPPPRDLKPIIAAFIGGAALLGLAFWLWSSTGIDLPEPKAMWTTPAPAVPLADSDKNARRSAIASSPARARATPIMRKMTRLDQAARASGTTPPPNATTVTRPEPDAMPDKAMAAAATGAAPPHPAPPVAPAAPTSRTTAPIAPAQEAAAQSGPPTQTVIAPLHASGEDAPPDPAPALNAPPTIVTKISVLAHDPGGQADHSPPPEMMGTEFSPLAPPLDPEDLADSENAAEATDGSNEAPAHAIAGPGTPRPPEKPGAAEDAETAELPLPIARPETQPDLTPEPQPDAPSTHALAKAPRPLPKPVSAKDLAEAEDLTPTGAASLTAPRPATKPRGLKRRAAALATARAKAREQAKAAAAAPTRRQIPSSASLSAAATIRDGVDLERTTLIGVFGASNARRAMVRLKSGDILTVRKGEKVGDWRVAAIGQSSIRLTRNGSNQTLNIPGQ